MRGKTNYCGSETFKSSGKSNAHELRYRSLQEFFFYKLCGKDAFSVKCNLLASTQAFNLFFGIEKKTKNLDARNNLLNPSMYVHNVL